MVCPRSCGDEKNVDIWFSTVPKSEILERRRFQESTSLFLLWILGENGGAETCAAEWAND